MTSKIVKLKGRSNLAVGGEPASDEKTREHHRVPYSGNLNEAEINRPGGLLLAALIGCANERRMQLNDMAAELGVTYGYINQLRNGIRQVNQVSDDFALACAEFLCVPRLTVLMLAGRITPDDAFEFREQAPAEIERAMSFICDDPVYGPMVTPELRKSSIESKYALVRLYEAGTQKVLLGSHISLGALATEVQKLKAVQGERGGRADTRTTRGRQDS